MFPQRSPLLHFGPFTVDQAGHCLLRDGVRVVVQEQPYRILLALLENPGQVVTRESLRLRLWGEETFVDFDQSLNSAVRRLRVALDDSPRQPVYVGTVPRVGFRFLAEVRRESAAVAAESVEAGEAEMGGAPFPVAPDSLPALLPAGATASSRWPVWSFVVLFGLVAGGCGVLASAGASRVGGWFGVGRMGTVVDVGTTFVDRDAGGGRGTPPGAGDDGASAPGADHGADKGNATTSTTPSGGGQGRLSDAGALLPVLLRTGRGAEVTRPERLTELTGWYHLGLRTEMDYGLARHAFGQAIAADPKSATPLVGLAETEILMALNGSAPSERLRAARAWRGRRRCGWRQSWPMRMRWWERWRRWSDGTCQRRSANFAWRWPWIRMRACRGCGWRCL